MKKTLTLKDVVLSLFLTLPLLMNAQTPKTFGKSMNELKNPEDGITRCISTEYEKYLQEINPERANAAEFESWIGQKVQERRALSKLQKSGDGILTIPVVVHIIHNGDAIGSNENIKEGQVLSQIQVLNEDYRRMANTPGYNEEPNGADTGIEFCLAQIDPEGNPTNGIDRVKISTHASWATRSEVESNLKFSTIWDPTKYMNIWVANFSNDGDLEGVLGYAQFPSNSQLDGLENNGGSEDTDGVIINYKSFGSVDIFPNGTYTPGYNRGRTTSHEVGHFLGLRHIWGDGNGCNNTDYCDDTPFAAEANYNCDPGIDSCTSKPGLDMTNNYMDYSGDLCMNVFTQDQKERMVTVLANATRRKTLLTSNVCGLATTADFQALQETTVYPNPTQNELNISVANGDLPDTFVIYNALGQTVANVKVKGEAALTVDTSAYANGIYIIKIFKGSESKTIKFIKN